jgi:hypothetical protein
MGKGQGKSTYIYAVLSRKSGYNAKESEFG